MNVPGVFSSGGDANRTSPSRETVRWPVMSPASCTHRRLRDVAAATEAGDGLADRDELFKPQARSLGGGGSGGGRGGREGCRTKSRLREGRYRWRQGQGVSRERMVKET